MTIHARLLLSLCLVPVGACSGPSVEPPKNTVSSILPAESSEPPPTPSLDSIAAALPWPVATLRGTAPGARRVIVEAGARAWAQAVLPDGSFCLDAPLDEVGAHSFVVWAQGPDGALSAEAALLDVEHDPAAPPVDGLARCDGSDPATCATAVEACDNGRDDDCNGLADLADPLCSTCSDDFLEPNDGPDAPRIEPGRYRDLGVCAGNPDFYRVRLERWDRLTVHLDFRDADGDVDLRLYRPDGDTSIDSSVSVTDDEEIVWRADEAGDYVLRVHGFANAENTYAMTVTVD